MADYYGTPSATAFRAQSGQFSRIVYDRRDGQDVRRNIRQDYESRVLHRPSWGRGMVFDNDRYMKLNGNRQLTYGQIRDRYGLPPHVLRQLNNLNVPRGKNLDDYTPSMLRQREVKLPPDAIEKYLNR